MGISDIVLVVCSIGAIQSIFIGTYFLTLRKGYKQSNILLGLLLIALGLRVAKSTIWLFDDNVSQVILNLGFAAHLTIAPFLWLYINSLIDRKQFRMISLLHFLPALAVVVMSSTINESNFWYHGGYRWLLYHSLGYLLLAGYSAFALIKQQRKSSEHKRNTPEISWTIQLLIGVSVFCLAYFSNYVLRWTSYVTGPLLYAAVIYVLSFFVLRYYAIFTKPQEQKKYKNLNLDEQQAEHYEKKLLKVMTDERPFLESDFSLSRLSDITSIPKHILSHIFSERLSQSFTDFSNQYRVEEAKKLLESTEHSHLKISSIAFESGFNTLSAFNTAFKKITGQTPSAYRKAVESKVA
ncbi:MAG: helix-turn-helix domain-containing protein [Bacteroidota bacterium]